MKLVSSKIIIGELFADFNLPHTDWLASVNRHIARGVEIMQLSNYFKVAFQKTTVQDYSAPLPCDQKELLAVLTIHANSVCLLPIKHSPYIGKSFANYINHSHSLAAINYNHVSTTFETGSIGFVYHAIPLDDEGYPMIPDNPFVLEALPFFVIMKLGYSGYAHPVITREEAESKWNTGYPRARNNVNFPSIEEMENFTNANTNPYHSWFLSTDFYESVDNSTPVFLSNNLANNILSSE